MSNEQGAMNNVVVGELWATYGAKRNESGYRL
jgi:hypothetical protein